MTSLSISNASGKETRKHGHSPVIHRGVNLCVCVCVCVLGLRPRIFLVDQWLSYRVISRLIDVYTGLYTRFSPDGGTNFYHCLNWLSQLIYSTSLVLGSTLVSW